MVAEISTELECAMIAALTQLGYTVTKADYDSPTAPVVSRPATGPVDSPEFTKFWSLYPRKENKAAARKAWGRVIHREAVNAALANQVAAGMFSDDPKFIPMASTWLNQQRWENPIVKHDRDAVRRGAAAADALTKFLEDK